ncbi:WhiB family transcriptional regulator [Streptomyces sp. IBSNAI002]|uniref:WhiB family transcriptional regulator n=1 Tax=Streptomyces sp. IBSNAI002 TaxID=3457500 RepID=UPI003FD1DFBF
MTTTIYTRRYGRAPSAAGRAPDWRDQAACLGKGTLFLPQNEFSLEAVASVAEAKRICARCPVLEACLADAMATEYGHVENGRAGVRGGLTIQERTARYKRQRRNVPEPPTLLDGYLRRTEALDDGHVLWTVTNGNVVSQGRQYTGKQLAWALATVREPVGVLRAECGFSACVAAEHLSDENMRVARDRYRRAS